MSPSATIVVPTQRRPDYLAVALASIAPQARAMGVQMLVVDDGPSAETRAVAADHGARYVAHDGPRGLNAARNTGLTATDSELVIFVDDDVAVHPGWLPALLAAASELPEEVGVLTGPIVPVFEDHALRICGREGAPITFLDLGPHDVDAQYAWGANMAVRRSAIARVGPFDDARPLYGDEAEWQDALRAAGGRIRYVAAAGLDHRRAGDDSRLRALCSAAHGRGVASRRYDVFRARAPTLRRELRILAGCAMHTVRFGCANGIVMTAHSLGRTREAWEPQPPPAAPGADDFLSGVSGTVGGLRGRLARVRDALLDLQTPRTPVRKPAVRPQVLIVAIARPDVANTLDATLDELRGARRADVTVRTAPAGALGKFENLNALLGAENLERYDWLIVVDDDIDLPGRFLDRFLAHVGEARLAQPAHRLHSHAAWPHTRRRARSAARATTFVEIGPLTAFHRDTFAILLPFPELRMGWGLDAHWAAVAREQGWPMAIVDATPIGHTLRPIAATYPREAALQEARAFLADRPYLTRDEVR